MKFSSVCIITIILVIMTILFAGCSDPAQTASPETPEITAIETTPAGTSEIIPARLSSEITPEVTTIPAAVRIFKGDYHWAEYRENNTVTMPPNPRFQWEYTVKAERTDDNYKGIPAIRFIITSTSDYAEWVNDKLENTANGLISVSDTYYDRSTNAFLGGTWSETIKGVSKTADYSAYYAKQSREDKPGGDMGITPFGEMDITFIDKGTESVTVPAGTFPNSRKYSGNFLDGTQIMFWVVPGVPVPVQYQFPNKYMDGVDPFQSYELKGWG
jgi:hypothetical protein